MNPRLIDWLLENVGVVIVIAIAVFSFLRGLFRAMRGGEEQPRRASQREQLDDPDAAERTRRIQEEIRRKIAERRGETDTAEPAINVYREAPEPARERIPPIVRPREIAPVDPFGGPMRKIMRKLEEAAERRVETASDSEMAAVLERQRKLQEQMRALESARQTTQRRGEESRAFREAPALVVARNAGRDDLRDQLRDPRELRRAIVLREVLGTPVGLR